MRVSSAAPTFVASAFLQREGINRFLAEHYGLAGGTVRRVKDVHVREDIVIIAVEASGRTVHGGDQSLYSYASAGVVFIFDVPIIANRYLQVLCRSGSFLKKQKKNRSPDSFTHCQAAFHLQTALPRQRYI